MAEKQNNIIRKQTVHFQYNGNTDGFALQKEVSDWCTFILIPEIEQQLELFDFDDSYLTIDKLEIDAAIDKNTDWQQKIRNELIDSLGYRLRDYKPAKKKSEDAQKSVSRSYKLDELVLFYFEKGYLPWWSKAFVQNNFDEVLLKWITGEKSAERAAHIIIKLQQISSGPVIQRILKELPKRLFFEWVKQIFKKETEVIDEAESFFTKVLSARNTAKAKVKPDAVYEVILAMLINGKIDIDLSIQVFLATIKNEIGNDASVLKDLTGNAILPANSFAKAWQNLLSEEIKNNVSKNTEEVKKSKLKYQRAIDQLTVKNLAEKNKQQVVADLQEGIYIENAGAVIIAAFLPVLFERLKIVTNGVVIKSDLGSLIIQYIVSGKSKAEEHELLLPKILCGISPELPVNTNKKITAAQKNEADEMLGSVIAHWAVIKNTSIAGLRESFLKRSGKLMLIDDEWLLQVEQKSYDMLLQQLPWNISMIKLPWMKNLLKTEWV